MKYYISWVMLLVSLHVNGQLNNTPFEREIQINPTDSGRVAFGVHTLGFTKNNEYFNDIADGYTLFGYQLNPYIRYQPLPNVTFKVGIYAQKDFGTEGYESIAPTYSFRYVKDDISLIFGTLEGNVSHRLIEPIYDFEKVLIDRLENGFQLKLEKENIFVDVWADWQKMIFKGDDDQEEVTAGISIDYNIINNNSLQWSIPIQGVVFHRGGQIDDNPNPLQTFWNSAVGTELKFKMGEAGFLKNVRLSPYYLYYKDFSFEKLSTFKDGSGVYLNIAAETNHNVELMLSYWKGHEFMSIMGGQLYPSVSSTFKNPFYTETDRELLIIRFFHKLQLAEDLILSTRFEPFFDLKNSKFEFSHGFYLNYNIDFRIKKDNR